MIKAILFDFDGTLLNTNNLIFSSYSHAFKTVLGRDITEKEIHALYGKPLYDSLAKYGVHQDELYREYRKYNLEKHDELVEYFDNAAEGVIMLKECGYKLAVVTSKRMDTLMRGIHLLKLDNYFDTLITPADTDKHKPDPSPILTACERLSVKADECIMVGDSIFDLQCGRAAGARLCAVKYSTTFDALLEYNPEYIVDSIKELANIINEERESERCKIK